MGKRGSYFRADGILQKEDTGSGEGEISSGLMMKSLERKTP
jgi:hypothetical protein